MLPKFRAWDKFEKEMLNVHGINYDADGVWTKEVFDEEDTGDFIHFSDIELLQSTGLLDKNGKEIFEGDILKYRDEYRVVEMYDGAWVARTGEKQLIVKMVVLSGAEIIGNRFENRGLLDYDSE